MLNPLYGQSDSGAIWNRTWNDFITAPEGCGFERCPQEPCVYSKRLGDPHEDGPDDSYVTCPIYVDDGRLYYDPTDEACSEAERDRARLSKEFGIEFKAIDPVDDYQATGGRRVLPPTQHDHELAAPRGARHSCRLCFCTHSRRGPGLATRCVARAVVPGPGRIACSASRPHALRVPLVWWGRVDQGRTVLRV